MSTWSMFGMMVFFHIYMFLRLRTIRLTAEHAANCVSCPKEDE